MRYSAEERYLLKDPCVYCGGVPTALDHIVPRSHDGKNWWGNRAPACIRCDNWKGDESLLFFLMRLQRETFPAASKRQVRRHVRTRAAFEVFDKPGCFPSLTRLHNGELSPDTIWTHRLSIETKLQEGR